MLSSKYGFGQSMDCPGQSMDPYFERAIHGLSKHKMTHRGVLIGTSSKYPPRRDQVPPSRERVSFTYRGTMQTF